MRFEYRPSMKRRAFKLVVFLLLGAIVNVAVVNGLAPWARHPSAEHVQRDLVSLADRYAISIAVQREKAARRWTRPEDEIYIPTDCASDRRWACSVTLWSPAAVLRRTP